MLLLPTSDPVPEPLDTDVGSVAVTREGAPELPALLCLHGIPGSVRDFRYLAPRLSDRFHVVRIDMPGFGVSPVGEVRTVEGWGDTADAVARALGIERYVAVAHSFGGAAALAAAHRHPRRVAGLALLASPGGRLHRGFGVSPLVFQGLARVAGLPLLREGVAALARAQYARRGLKAPADASLVHNQLQVIGSLRFERLRRWAHELRCPVLLAHSADDPLVEIDIAREQAAVIADCRALFFEDGGHFIQKTHAADIASAIADRFA